MFEGEFEVEVVALNSGFVVDPPENDGEQTELFRSDRFPQIRRKQKVALSTSEGRP